MSTPSRVVLVLVTLLAAAGGGFLIGRRSPGTPAHPDTPTPRGERRVLYYRNPMDPSVRSATPAKDSMGMDYVPVYEDEATADTPAVAGRATVVIPPERRQVLGLRSEPVRMELLAHRIRTVGVVAVDERRLHRVQTKYEGYVERVFVDFTGRRVRRGE